MYWKGAEVEQATKTKAELAIELVERGIVKGDLSVVDELISPHYVEHQYGPRILTDPRWLRRFSMTSASRSRISS